MKPLRLRASSAALVLATCLGSAVPGPSVLSNNGQWQAGSALPLV